MTSILYTLVIIVVLTLLGLLLIPPTSSVTVEISFDAKINEVWRIYTEPENQSDWRPDVGHISVSHDGKKWTETLKRSGMTIHFELVEKTQPHRLVLKTGSPDNFEGKYTAEFMELDGHTIGVFTEETTA